MALFRFKKLRELAAVDLFLSLAFVCFLCVASVARGAEITLASQGASDYAIVLPSEPSATQRSAASELQTYFKQVTDIELPIISETDATVDLEDAQYFVVGPSALSKKFLGSNAEEEIGYDGIIVKSVGKSIVLSGAPLRGSIYSVYEFLEKKLGCRWWTSTESTIPHTPTLKIENDLDVRFTPPFEYRESYYRDTIKNPMFGLKLRCNGNFESIPSEYGSHRSFQYFVHSSYSLIPPQKYFLDHPDWFSEIDGVRKLGYPSWSGSPTWFTEFRKQLKPEQIHDSGTQLCFSNDEMIAEMIKNAREVLRKNPNASFLSVSQNDWRGFCTCEKCRKIDEEEGSHAGSLLRAVNKVAEALEDEFPNVYVETLAYQYTRKPPKITKPRKNVVVRLCSIECSFGRPLDSEANKTFRDDIVGWSKVADKLFVWDYITDFAYYILPFPNYRVLDRNINFYKDHNVVGMFEQGDYEAQTGDFVQLRNWVVAKLLWNPSLDVNALVDEFIAGYYAPELVDVYREYFETLLQAVESKDFYLGIYLTTTNGWLDLDSLNKVTLLQRKALEIAQKLEKESPERCAGLTTKVRREQIPLDVVWQQEYRRAKFECKLRGIEFLGPKDPLQAAKNLVAKFDEFGLTLHREWESPEAFKQYKESLIAQYEDWTEDEVEPTPDFCKETPENCWVSVQNYDMSRNLPGKYTFEVKDENASNGRAVKMPGDHFEWATSWGGSPALALLKPIDGEGDSPEFHVYAYLRCDASVDDGQAATLGVYDEVAKKSVLYKSLDVSEIKGSEYKRIDLGVAPFTRGQYVWFAPPKRPGEVDALYIDRIVIVREK